MNSRSLQGAEGADDARNEALTCNGNVNMQITAIPFSSFCLFFSFCHLELFSEHQIFN